MANRRLSGLRAYTHGRSFENVFKQMCGVFGVGLVEIPSGCVQAGKKLIRVRSPFDYVISYANVRTIVDCKSVDTGNFVYSKITPHQLNAFRKLRSGGYVVRLDDFVYFVPWEVLDSMGPGESVNIDDCVKLGTDYRFDPRLIFT